MGIRLFFLPNFQTLEYLELFIQKVFVMRIMFVFKLCKYVLDHTISSLEIDIFDLKMIVLSGLEFFILKFTEPLQSYPLTFHANSAFLGRLFCTEKQQQGAQ